MKQIQSMVSKEQHRGLDTDWPIT